MTNLICKLLVRCFLHRKIKKKIEIKFFKEAKVNLCKKIIFWYKKFL